MKNQLEELIVAIDSHEGDSIDKTTLKNLTLQLLKEENYGSKVKEFVKDAKKNKVDIDNGEMLLDSIEVNGTPHNLKVVVTKKPSKK